MTLDMPLPKTNLPKTKTGKPVLSFLEPENMD